MTTKNKKRKSNWRDTKRAFTKRMYGCMAVIAFMFCFMCLSSATQADNGGDYAATSALSLILPFSIMKRAPGKDDEPGGDVEKEKALKLVKEVALQTATDELKKFKEADPQYKALMGLIDQLKHLPTEAESKEMTEKLNELYLHFKSLKDSETVKGEDYRMQVKKFITDNQEKIKAIHKSGSGVIELELKAAGDITTGSGTTVGTQPTNQIFGNPVFNLITTFIEKLVSVSATNTPNYPYTEMLPKDGDFTFLGEGETKQQIDFKWETRWATPKKAAAWERLTTEAVQDIPRMESLANELLKKKHDIFKQRGIIAGDGTGDNPKGIVEYGRAFVAGAMANKVITPNLMDIINACIVDIRTTHNYTDEIPFAANVVFINDVDFYLEVQTAKDDNGRPLFDYNPVLNSAFVGNVMIVPTQELDQDEILVCDASKYNVVNYIPYTVKIGWINDDFIKNQFVILAESRFMAFVKKLDEQAFIFDKISTIRTAITKAVI